LSPIQTPVLVTGCSGSLGWVLARILAEHHPVVGTYQTNASCPEGTEGVGLNLAEPDAIRWMLEKYHPSTIFHLAAMTDPDRCERDREMARTVNLDATRELAGWAADSGANLMFASTDLVFDGKKGDYREEDQAHPLSVYGRTKLDAERAVLELCPRAIVIRGSLFYGVSGPAGRTFLSPVLESLISGAGMELFTDQKRNPILLEDLAGAMIRLSDLGLTGLYHAAGGEVVTRYEFGRFVCEVFGFDKSLLRPIRMADFEYCAPRPLDSSLNVAKIRRAIGFEPTPIREALQKIRTRIRGL